MSMLWAGLARRTSRRSLHWVRAASSIPNRSFSATLENKRAELHKLALQQNVEMKQKFEQETMLQKDIPDVELPHSVRFHRRDTYEERIVKQRQQFYYMMHEKFGYLDDIYVKKGWMSQDLLDQRRTYVAEQLALKPPSKFDVPEVSMSKLIELQETYSLADDVKISEGDSAEEKQRKALAQIQVYIEQTSKKLDEAPEFNKQLEGLKKAHQKISSADAEEIELFLMENSEKLEEAKEMSYSDIGEFMRDNAHRMLDVLEQQAQDPLDQAISHKPLDMLGLIRQGSVDAINDQLTAATKLQKKRFKEFHLRFGAVPADPELDEAWKAEELRQYQHDLEVLRADSQVQQSEKQLDGEQNAPSEEAAAADKEDDSKKFVEPDFSKSVLQSSQRYKEMHARVFGRKKEGETDSEFLIRQQNDTERQRISEKYENNEQLTAEEIQYLDDIGMAAIYFKDVDAEIEHAQKYFTDPEYKEEWDRKLENEMAQDGEESDNEESLLAEAEDSGEESDTSSSSSSSSSEGEEGDVAENEAGAAAAATPAPAAAVHAPRSAPKADLKKYSAMRDFDYSAFEEPPTDFEVYIMDQFAQQNQRKAAKEQGVTLFPRIPVPSGPTEPSWIVKSVHLYRIRALRVYIENLRQMKRQELQREWRDLDLLELDIDDPKNPWKLELFNECKLRLSNSGKWTQQQKEDFLRTLHYTLTVRVEKPHAADFVVPDWDRGFK